MTCKVQQSGPRCHLTLGTLVEGLFGFQAMLLCGEMLLVMLILHVMRMDLIPAHMVSIELLIIPEFVEYSRNVQTLVKYGLHDGAA